MKIFLLTALLMLGTLTANAQNFDTIPQAKSTEMQETSTPQVESTAPQVVSTPQAPSTPQACGDDPRFDDIISVLENPAAITKPLSVTAKTFLDLDDELEKALRGKMFVCPDNMVLKSGRTMKKIQVDFDVAMDKINRAIMADDFEQVEKLMQVLAVHPMEPKDMLKLFITFPLDDKKHLKLNRVFGVNHRYYFFIEIFTALGGKATKSVDVHIKASAFSGDELAGISNDALYIDGISNYSGWGTVYNTFIRNATLAGLNVIKY